jgi:uncharacterized protein (DUF4213/DUF364 family)
MATTGSINAHYLALGQALAARLGNPVVDGLHLPDAVPDETFRDAFGFVFLADDSVGPFYVSMGELLRELWRRHPAPQALRGGAAGLLQGLVSVDPASRALALGTYNALSAALFRTVGFEPPDRGGGSGLDGLAGDATIGMVGYFGPLVDRLTARGNRVLVLEQSPQRVPDRAGVAATGDAAQLGQCARVLCTASTLVNDSLSGLLAAVGPDTPVELVGPSGSGLPDPLFARGVVAVGGISFDGRASLLEKIGRGETWGKAGRKYQLAPSNYPGLAALLERL